jgi:hypothetical protein
LGRGKFEMRGKRFCYDFGSYIRGLGDDFEGGHIYGLHGRQGIVWVVRIDGITPTDTRPCLGGRQARAAGGNDCFVVDRAAIRSLRGLAGARVGSRFRFACSQISSLAKSQMPRSVIGCGGTDGGGCSIGVTIQQFGTASVGADQAHRRTGASARQKIKSVRLRSGQARPVRY